MATKSPDGLKYTLQQLLSAMVNKGASDMHITAGQAPALRIDGSVMPLKLPPLTPDETRQLCYSALANADQRALFEKRHELDLSFSMPGLSRFRANLFLQQG